MTRFAMQSFTWNVKLFPGLAAGNVGTAVQDGVEGRRRRHDCYGSAPQIAFKLRDLVHLSILEWPFSKTRFFGVMN